MPRSVPVIVVVEGPSAAGKTTWVRRHAVGNSIPENGSLEPPTDATLREVAAFWTEANERRWAAVVGAEEREGDVVCDTDPLKLHFSYCCARLGALPWTQFDLEVRLAWDGCDDRRLGMADLVLVEAPDDRTLEQRRAGDATRRRRNFDLHRRFTPFRVEWYAALDRLDSGRALGASPTRCGRRRPGLVTTPPCSTSGCRASPSDATSSANLQLNGCLTNTCSVS